MRIESLFISSVVASKRRAQEGKCYSVRLPRTATVFGGLLALVAAIAPSSAEAQCAQWDVSGQWGMTQGKTFIPVNLRQKGKVVTGTATHMAYYNPEGKVFGAERKVEGSIDGTVVGDEFNVQIYWPDGLVGVYRGKIGPQGRIEGTTYDKNKPSINATWYSNRVMTCDEAKPVIKASDVLKYTGKTAPPAPTPRRQGPPVKSTGKRPMVPSAPATVPRIIAFNKPGQPPGTQTLTWDGGPEHPYAEVWVKVGDEDEVKVVEQGKGSRQITVEPGKEYLYILTDSGQRLATTTARGK